MFGVNRLDETQLINNLGRPRHQLTDRGLTVSMFGELENGTGHRQRRLVGGHAGDALTHADALGQVLAIEFVQLRLVVEQVELARPTVDKRWTSRVAVGGVVGWAENALERIRLPRPTGGEKVHRGNPAEPEPAPSEELPACTVDRQVVNHGSTSSERNADDAG